MARVIAKERGHCGVCVREVGEVFDVPDSRLEDGTDWFEPVDGPRKPAKAVDARPPGAGPAKGGGTGKDDKGAPAPGAPNPAAQQPDSTADANAGSPGAGPADENKS